ncbi:pyridoxal phosphate-dependent aminotransferase [Clostridium sediminicola]|uniref:pyridoxal phosphate-dependent aminotransferase n=1 Tax=Clostridium sediminicola TaxID=3114879 RepID=UPI0031F26D66
MFSDKIVKNLENSSWIRAMFEEGAKLAKKYGPENVYDYSIGNPYAEPPKEVFDSLKKHTSDDEKGLHRYMSNAGFVDVRQKLANKLSEESGVELSHENVVMTVGAAGALNVTLKSILNPQEEVILFSPYFVEYGTYIDNVGGKAVVISTDKKTFEPDLEILEKSINSKTKAIIINSPNNPTGVIYKEEKLKAMAELLLKKERELGIKIYVISDEPYSRIVYDDVKVPSVLGIFDNAIVVNSYSKSLGLAGERIGYIAASSKIENINILMTALAYCNRTLGFVNAPALFQKVIGDALDAAVDVNEYKKRRDYLYENLTRLGFDIVKPEGAFYLFPKALIEDDVEFVRRAQKYNLLLVPGSGFGCPGYFRMSYCVKFDMIERSIPAFEKLVAEFKK